MADAKLIDEEKDKIERLRRYEDARREHLSGALNLIFGLSAAALGFCVTNITDKNAVFSPPGSYYLVSSTIVFLITVGLCMLTMWTRLRDFRETARILRRELKGASAKELENPRADVENLGIRTWFLLRAQLITFFLGILLLTLALWEFNHNRLFPKEPANASGVPRQLNRGEQSRQGSAKPAVPADH